MNRNYRGILIIFIWAWITQLLPAAQLFERPVPEGGGPTMIRCAMAVLDIDEISDSDQNFTANLYARFQWHDPREAHGENGKIVKGLNEIWHPDLLFINMQKSWSNLKTKVEVSPEGDVVLRQQLWADFSQPMNLHDFPFDQQDLEIRVIPGGADAFDEVTFVQDPEFQTLIVENYSVPDWTVLGHQSGVDPLVMPNGKQLASYTLNFSAKRLSNHYVIKVIAPLLMILMLSWVVFWLDPSAGDSQLGVAVTCFLTVIAYHIALASKLPEIPYLTRLDGFVFSATVLVFLAMIEVVITTGMARNERVKGARWLDRVCRLIFPAALAIGALYSFVWF